VKMYQLIDTHAHLEEIDNLEQVITAAKAAGVAAVVAVGSDYRSNEKVLAIAQRYKGFVYPALGLHPSNISQTDVDATLKFIEAHIKEVAGVGEIGLDYQKQVRERTDKETQQNVLRALFSLSKAYDKPALIHSRYAWKDTFDLAVEAKLTKAVFHWYTGPSSVLRGIIEQGYYLSATPSIEYHEEHRRAIKEIPLERLLLETDSPVTYLWGKPDQFESRPADVTRVLKAVATLRGLPEAEIAEITTANAARLFGLPKLKLACTGP
jgi:TatD DNase family protein